MHLHQRDIVDLFAGPGGWDVAAKRLGLDPLGIEWDGAACATRKAAGLQTLHADVATVNPVHFGPLWGLIASPPCQAWSMAGKGGGRRDKDLVVQCAGELAAGVDTRDERRQACEDLRSMLVVEPLRWALALEPEWIALEQVPPVLELWSMFAQILALKGYSTWTGVLEAERYGVPQTRERAILLARLSAPVEPPRATHQRYVPGEPARHDVTLEGEVLPWVSMADALGWTARGAVRTGNFTAKSHRGERGVMYERDIGEPAPTVTGNADRWGLDRRQGGAPVRKIDEPAHTMSSQGLAKGRDVWVPASTAELQGEDWPERRPATTVAGDPRIFQPGGHHVDGAQSHSAIRVTVEEASILQTFPPDYPWQGSRAQQYQQIGNAVPPMLAEAVLRVVAQPAAMELAA